MGKRRKFFEKIVSGQSDKNISFDRMCTLLKHLGFTQRISGDHHVFEKPGVDHPINIQPTKEGKVKPYQVKQIRKLLLDYKLEP